jgi:hypothetical protein
MKRIFGLLLLFVTLSAQAQLDIFTNYGGLYFCPDSKDLMYVEWDNASDQHNAIAVYWSATGQKPRRMEIATQYTMTKRTIQNDEYFIQLWEEARPNAQYQCMFRANVHAGRPSMTMNLEGASRQYEFVMIGDEENGYMDEGDKQHESMMMTLSNLKFYVFNKDNQTYSYDTPVTVGLAEDPSILQILVGTEEAGTTFLATFNNSFEMLAGVGTVDRSKNAYRLLFGIYKNTAHLLVIHVFGSDGTYFYSLAESYSDFVGEDTF